MCIAKNQVQIIGFGCSVFWKSVKKFHKKNCIVCCFWNERNSVQALPYKIYLQRRKGSKNEQKSDMNVREWDRKIEKKMRWPNPYDFAWM